MADQLNMGGLNLGEGQQQQGARSYIPPHMRNRGPAPAAAPAAAPNGAPAGPAANGLGNSNWSG